MNSSKQGFIDSFSLRLTILLTIGLCPFADAADPVRLTNDGKMKQDLCFTHDTQELIYSVLKTPQLIKLQRLNIDSGTIEDFHTSANTNEIYIVDEQFVTTQSHLVENLGLLLLIVVIRVR